MTAGRRVIELSIGDADVAKLTSIARLRTEPASRVERALCALPQRPIFLCAVADADPVGVVTPALDCDYANIPRDMIGRWWTLAAWLC
jgi:hypothetical protein